MFTGSKSFRQRSIYVRGVNKQKFSEACRPILKDKTDKAPGKLIDVLAVAALIAGTATTFSVATPLLAGAIGTLFGIETTKWLTIIILIAVCATYTTSVMHGIKGVAVLSSWCMYFFGGLLLYVLVFGGQFRFTIENGLTGLGHMVQNFIELSTWTDALRESSFPQIWTIFYWAYWIVWCVAAPFFMGQVSRGRTVRQVILGSYVFGLASTYCSFIVMGNFGIGMQEKGIFDAVGFYEAGGDIYGTVIAILQQLPLYQIVLVLLVLSMTAFYASSFDSITLVACQYSYKESDGSEAPVKMKLFWAILLILLPIALIFSEGSMNNLQTVSIIAAFPLAAVIILIIAAFIKDAGLFLEELRGSK
ncbi:MAG: BCCT family transporter [Solobacterium sp.]|nr:BCCT family transporter [Solobacterium sp.]